MWDYGRRKSDGRRVEDRARAEAVKKLKEIEEQMDSFFKLYAGVNCDSINMPTPKCSECGCILSKEEIEESHLDPKKNFACNYCYDEKELYAR